MCLRVHSLPVWQENPYMMRKANYQDLQGNDQYEGFCVDMLRELADILKFSFRIKLVDDGLYGAPEPNGSWTGMVGELMDRVSSEPWACFYQEIKKPRQTSMVGSDQYIPGV